MSYLASDAILDRVKEVLEQSKGSLRTVPLLRFQGNLPPGLTANAELRRALMTPRVAVAVTGIERSPSTSPVLGNQLLYKITLEIRIVRAVQRNAQLDEDIHRALTAQAMLDADVIRQSVEYPNNLLTTEAGVATGIVSGMLMHLTSRSRVNGQIVGGAQVLETIHAFWGTARSTPAIAVSTPTITELELLGGADDPSLGGVVRVTVTGEPTPALTVYRVATLVGSASALYEIVAADLLVAFLMFSATNASGTATRRIGMRSEVFTASGTWQVPAGVTTLYVLAYGGGGGGGAANTYGGGGGGGGALKTGNGVSVTPGETVTVVIGAGGGPGVAGGNTTGTVLVGTITASGGSAGIAGSGLGQGAGGAGGTTSKTFAGGTGGGGGGSLIYGGGGGAGGGVLAVGGDGSSAGTGGVGGDSDLGEDGGNGGAGAVGTTVGADGESPGGGGGGASTGAVAGSGASGLFIIYY